MDFKAEFDKLLRFAPISILQVFGLEKRLSALEEGGGAGGNHAALSNLGYSSAGHTGFEPALGFTAVPNTRKVNGQALSSDITISTAAGDTIKKTYTQSSHGFVAGNAINRTSGAWAKAKADDAATADVEGIVESVDGNDFVLVEAGEIAGLSGGTDGAVGFLSAATAGAITTTEPSTEGYISKPLIKWRSTTAAIVNIMRGVEVAPTSLDHGALTGLGDDDHTQYHNDTRGDARYVAKSLATAENDVLVGAPTPFGSWVKKTLAEFQTILGLGTAAYTASTAYAPSANGVTGGDSHDHSGGDGAQIVYSTLGSIPSTFDPSTHGSSAHSDSYLASTAFVGFAKLTVATDAPGSPGVNDLWVDLP